MWIRLLLLVGIVVGVNWAITEQIKKQQKEKVLTSEVEQYYAYAHKQKYADRLVALSKRAQRYRQA